MVDFAFRGDVLMRDLLVQSTVIFAVGLLVARYARLPARTHAVLLMAFLGAVATPLASGIVRYRGWGILEPQVSVNVQATRSPQVNLRSDMRAQVEQEASYAAARHAPAEVGSAPRLDPRSSPDVRDAASRAIRTSSPSGVETAVARLEAAPEKPRGGSFSAVAVFAALWFIGSVIAVGRLLCAMLESRRLMAAAEPCQVETVESALRLARERLGFESLSIHVFQSPALRCPVISCWGRCPRLVLPCEAAERWSITAWTPILCHELAHWKRHDHLTALAAELVCCLMPWQPLAWWAKRRLEQASEQACDDWAVAAGHSATDYAETLLGLIAQPGSPLQLAALRRKSGLGDRIRHILTQRVPRPRLGRGWTFVIVIGTAAITGTAAFCQRGEVRAESATAAPGKTKSTVQAELEKNDSAVSPAAQAAPVQEAKQDSPSDQPKHYTAAGRVIGPNSQPIAGANVIWETKRVEKPKDWGNPAHRCGASYD